VKRTYFNELATRWDSLPGPPDAQRRAAEFCRLACPSGAARVLDVGSGTGLLVPHLLGRIPADGTIVALDFAIEMLREGRRKHADPRLSCVCADARGLPFPEGAFDAVLCFGVLPHLGGPDAALPELWRVLRPGGVLAVGHLMGSAELNALHRSLGEPVAGDTLIPAALLADMLHKLGAGGVRGDETPEKYFVRAEKDTP